MNWAESDEDSLDEEEAVITRTRHRRHVEEAAEALRRFCIQSGEGYIALDMAAEELRLATSELGRITGAVDVLDLLFSDFALVHNIVHRTCSLLSNRHKQHTYRSRFFKYSNYCSPFLFASMPLFFRGTKLAVFAHPKLFFLPSALMASMSMTGADPILSVPFIARSSSFFLRNLLFSM